LFAAERSATVQARQLKLGEAVRMLSFETATAWGFYNRGLLRDGEHTGALPGQLLRGPLYNNGKGNRK